MIYDEFKKVKVGGTCVIIRTGEPGTVTAVNHERSEIQLEVKKGPSRGKNWFNYCQLGKL